jgi:hypothetical protein
MSQPAASGAVAPDARTTGQLAMALSDQVSRLVKDEIALATADMKSKTGKLAAGGGLLAAAGVLAFSALIALLVAGGLGIAVALPSWLAALIMGGAFLVGAALLGLVGIRSLKGGTPPVPQEAIGGLKLDLAIVKQVKP